MAKILYFPQRKLEVGELVLGEGYKLGAKFKKISTKNTGCIKKGDRSSMFCIEELIWEPKIMLALGKPQFFLGGGRAIVRYDDEKVTQYHTLFPTSSFTRISNYLQARFGGPTEKPKIWTHVLGGPKRLNTTLRWRGLDSRDLNYIILEIRRFDDLRWSGLPQMSHGVVRLFYEGNESFFQILGENLKMYHLLVKLQDRNTFFFPFAQYHFW